MGLPVWLLDGVFGPLAEWVRRLELHLRPGLANFFSEGELGSGAAAIELATELCIDNADDFARLAADLDKLVEFARLQAEQRRRGFAALAEHSFAFERRVRQRREAQEAAWVRFRQLDEQKERADVPALPARHRRGHRPRRLPQADGARGEQGEEEDRRRKSWMGRIYAILVDLKAPILRLVAGSNRPQELLASHLTGRRSATLAARTRAWEKYRIWLRRTYNVGHHLAAHHLLDYLLDRRAEPCTKGTLSAIHSMQRFADEILGVPLGERWTEDSGVQSLVRGIIAGANATSNLSVGPANMPMVGVLVRLEELICDEAADCPARLVAWWMSVSSWASFRYDDHAGLSPEDVVTSDDGVDLTLRRTKTTGPDKAVRERRTVVAKGAWLVKPHWMEAGLNLWREFAPRPREYFLTQFRRGGSPQYRALGYSEYSSRMREILANMRDDRGEPLGGAFATYLRPHSWRSFLPSALIALGASADSLRWLSAWRAQSVDAYVRTSRARTLRLQASVGDVLRLHLGNTDPIAEHRVLSDLVEHLKSRNCTDEEADRIYQSLCVFPQGASRSTLWDVLAESSTVEGGASSSAVHEPPGEVERESDSELKEDKGSSINGYVVAITRKRGRRCLHKLGLCYRRPGKHYFHYKPFGAARPEPTEYDDFCRDCWRASRPDRSTTSAGRQGSDSGSSRRTSSSAASSADTGESSESN